MMQRHKLRGAWLALTLPTLVGACSTLTPDQAAPATALQVDPQIAARFPGARALVDGIDSRDERALREGDRLVLAIEVVVGGDVESHLLR